nr:uncharacterized protein LOC128681487 [Plodia interpunctella]
MSRLLAFVTVSAVLAQAYSQALVPISSLLPNQLLNFASLAPNVLCEETVVSAPIKAPMQPACLTPVLQSQYQTAVVQPPVVPTTTIIQDSTVANNLANALQLLIVSNLLSNTLPYMGDVVVPNYAPNLDVVAPIAPVSLAGLTYLY